MEKRNILFITCDQLRKDSLGIYENEVIRTPNIDAMFRHGVRFTNMFTAFPVCAPNRGAIATGRWPKVNGLLDNGYMLPHEEQTMMDTFRSNGYVTYGVGKMHFTPQWQWDMDDRGKGAINPQPDPGELPHYGFDHCTITEDHRIGPYSDYLREHGYDPWEDPHSFSMGKQHRTEASPYPEEHHQTTWITDRALDYLCSHKREKPFFMWLSYVDPHHPFNPPKPYDTLYNPADMPLPVYREGEHDKRNESFQEIFRGEGGVRYARTNFSRFKDSDWQRIKAYYYGMVTLIDKNIGRVIDYLKETGDLDTTVVVFTADHGETLGDHHLLFKYFPFDCVTAVPFLVMTPEMKRAKIVDTLCRSLEIMPTVLDLSGLPKPRFINGVSLIDQINGRPKELFDNILIEKSDMKTVRSKKYRLTVYQDHDRGELYDLKKDPHNLENVWDENAYRDVKDHLISQLIARLNEVTDPRFRQIAQC